MRVTNVTNVTLDNKALMMVVSTAGCINGIDQGYIQQAIYCQPVLLTSRRTVTKILVPPQKLVHEKIGPPGLLLSEIFGPRMRILVPLPPPPPPPPPPIASHIKPFISESGSDSAKASVELEREVIDVVKHNCSSEWEQLNSSSIVENWYR